MSEEESKQPSITLRPDQFERLLQVGKLDPFPSQIDHGRGAMFVHKTPQLDTVPAVDPETGKESWKLIKDYHFTPPCSERELDHAERMADLYDEIKALCAKHDVTIMSVKNNPIEENAVVVMALGDRLINNSDCLARLARDHRVTFWIPEAREPGLAEMFLDTGMGMGDLIVDGLRKLVNPVHADHDGNTSLKRGFIITDGYGYRSEPIVPCGHHYLPYEVDVRETDVGKPHEKVARGSVGFNGRKKPSWQKAKGR